MALAICRSSTIASVKGKLAGVLASPRVAPKVSKGMLLISNVLAGPMSLYWTLYPTMFPGLVTTFAGPLGTKVAIECVDCMFASYVPAISAIVMSIRDG